MNIELEIHHQHIGILAAVLAVLLAVVTITSQLKHTEAIIARSAANDAWAHYQSTRMKFHSLELGEDLISALAPVNGSAKIAEYRKAKSKYEKSGKDIMKEAREKEEETKAAEAHAVRYDVGEGLLEIGLVLSSLYFIANNKLFPAVGVLAGIGGLAFAISGYLK
jgi:hypothetical protein